MPRLCIQCNLIEVGVRQKRCLRCAHIHKSEWMKQWRAENAEKVRVSMRNWNFANKEKKREYERRPESLEAKKSSREKYRKSGASQKASRKWHDANKEIEAQNARARRKANPEKASILSRTHYHNRVARGAGSQYRHTSIEISELLEKQGRKCANSTCRADLSRGFQVDHIFPVSKGGKNDISNIQILCPPCNRRKWNKHPDQWAIENSLIAMS